MAKKDRPAKKEKKHSEGKIELEREYIIPIRRKSHLVPRYKRARKAIKIIKEFLAKHMKVADRDTRKVKVDMYLNEEIWFRGIKKPPAKIKVKAVKKDDGFVYAYLVDIPEVVKFKMARDARLQNNLVSKPKEEKKEEKKPEELREKETPSEEKKEEKEKEQATIETGLAAQKQEAQKQKHTSKMKSPQQKEIHRQALNRH